MRRTAAFHVGDMSREDWDALSLYDRFSWFYDYTHRTIENSKSLFSSVLEVHTETLSSPDTISAISEFVAGPGARQPAPVKLNAHNYITVFDFDDDP